MIIEAFYMILLIYLKSVFSGLRGKPVEGPRLHCQLRPRTPWYAILGTICGSKYNCIHPKAPCRTLFQLKIQFDPPKRPCGTLFRLKIQFDPPKRPLRDVFSAQNTTLSAQKAPAGRFSGSKYNFIRPKGPCGTLFRLKIQLHPPERPQRDAFLAQRII